MPRRRKQIQNIEALAEEYAGGRGLGQLAKESGVSSPTLRRGLEEHGAAIRPAGRPPRVATQELLEAYSRHGSVTGVAAEHDMSASAVRHRLLPTNAFPPGTIPDNDEFTAALDAGVARGGPEDCWPARGSKTEGGYVRISRRSVRRYAHRLAWELANNRPVPPGMQIVHSCDNRECANPAHLSAATPKENSRQMLERGRSGRAKLSPEDVRAIRALAAGGAGPPTLASEFGVSVPHIKRILNRQAWKDL